MHDGIIYSLDINRKIVYYNKDKKEKKVVFENGSKLKLIMQNAFSDSSIEKYILPPSILEIRDIAFYSCISLKAIQIPENSQLQVIYGNALSNTGIGSIVFPPCFRDIGNSVFYSCKKLNIIQKNDKIKHLLIEKDLFLHCNQEILVMVRVETKNQNIQ